MNLGRNIFNYLGTENSRRTCIKRIIKFEGTQHPCQRYIHAKAKEKNAYKFGFKN